MGNNDRRTTEGWLNRRTQIVAALIGAAAVLAAGWLSYSYNRNGGQPVPSAPIALKITGRVANAETDAPVRKATVFIESGGIPITTESDSNGFFLATVGAGRQPVRLRVTATGFEPYDQLLPDELPAQVPINLKPRRQGGRSVSQREHDPGLPLSPQQREMQPRATMAALLNTSLPVISGDDGPWTVVLFGDHERRDDVTTSVRSVLSGSGHDTVSLFRKVSDEQRLAADLYRGSSDLFAQLQPGRYCARLLVAKFSATRIGAAGGITYGRATLWVNVLSPTGEILKSFELSEKGRGEDDYSARRHAVDALIETLARELPTHLG
jgi:hypothetical protein